VSFLSYAPATQRVISLTVPQVRANEVFYIAIPSDGVRRTRVPMTSIDIESITSVPQSSGVALRMFRRGLTAESPFQALTDLWTGVEAVAERQAREADERVLQTCKVCGTKSSGPVASHSRIRKLYQLAKHPSMSDQDAAKSADSTRSLRGKLVHGAKLHDAALMHEVQTQLALLQSAAATAIACDSQIKTRANESQHVGDCYLGFDMRFDASTGSFMLNMRDFEAKAGISSLPSNYADRPSPLALKIGIWSDTPIDELAFPDIVT
jgi:hypothetical protein